MKEYEKSMTDELSVVTKLEAESNGDFEEIKGASSFVMFMDDSNNIIIKVFFDVDSIDKSFVAIKIASQNRMTFRLTAECGLEMKFSANTFNIGRNYASFKLKKKSIIDTF